ncbi:hypothetical protein JCM9279_004847 [Rhodotorula babjevae]
MHMSPASRTSTSPSSFATSSLLDALPSLSPAHRSRAQPSMGTPTPSSTYLDVASESSEALAATAADHKIEPLVVVLSLNDTVLVRSKRTTKGSANPIVRPFLATFLSYLVTSQSPAHSSTVEVKVEGGSTSGADTAKLDQVRPIEVVVYSAARAHNVLTLLRAIRLVPNHAYDESYRPSPAAGDALSLVLCREMMNLSHDDYKDNVVTCKDLGKVWDAMDIEHDDGTRRTVLLEEDAQAAAPQPHSHLPIPTFLVSSVSSTDQRRTVRELPSTAPLDTSLLSTIHLVELLRRESNVAAALKGGLVRHAVDDARRAVREREGKGERYEVSDKEVRDEMAQRGREVCARYGVEVRREWDDEWKAKVRHAASASA